MNAIANKFWEEKSLQELSRPEWESLCDGCGKCCLHKLEDEDTGELFFTRVACRLFNAETCECQDYENRLREVPECLYISINEPSVFEWLPSSCAYRRLFYGEVLPEWHHLIAGNKSKMFEQGKSVQGKTVSEEYVHPEGVEEHIVNWVDSE